jgi:hypothetical protein
VYTGNDDTDDDENELDEDEQNDYINLVYGIDENTKVDNKKNPIYGNISGNSQFSKLNTMLNDLYIKHLIKKHILECFVYRYRPPKPI